MNDLRSLQDNNCPFLVKFLGAMYEEGAVKIALEYMDMGSLRDLMNKAVKKNHSNFENHKPVVPESVMSKIVQQILAGLAYLNVSLK